MRAPSPPRSRRRLVLAVVATLVALWSASAGTVLWFASRDGAAPADAIVVLGAAHYRGRPSPVLRARLDHAVSLYARGLAPRLVLTGGVAEGDTASEAAVSRTYVMRQGVPDSAILLENNGRTTHQSLRAVARILDARGLPRAIVVSDGLHLFRAWTSARHHGLAVRTSPARPGTSALAQAMEQPLYFLAETFKAPLALFLEW
ncbi:MAG: YdcF family protein [Gemmatimonadaceae bacterium]|nr:YdcF family protein [Gemmatimonadaceae bacterium]